MKRKNSVLLVIDVQNDFMDIANSPLPVAGAVKDTERLVDFIKKVNPGKIFASQDTHYNLDISHVWWWKDHKGDYISPFTLITADDVRSGKYVPVIDPKGSLEYVESLEKNGEFLHFVWPDHCIAGTTGHSFLPIFQEALKEWSYTNKDWPFFIVKGVNPKTEHFGIFRANVPRADDASTDINQGIFNSLNTFDEMYLAGQARSHCVANSLRQLMQLAPQIAPKLIVLEDCMSDVTNLPSDFYDGVNKIYDDARALGVRFEKSTSF